MNPATDRPVVSFNLKPALRAGRFLLRAMRKRWWAVAGIAVVFTAMAAGAAAVLPKEYSGDTRLLTKKNYTMAALATPGRSIPPSSEAPAQSAAELALQREALVRIVRRARLVERLEKNAPPLMRAKQALRERLKGPLSREETEEALVGMLRMRVRVWLEEDVVRISASWWDADAVLAILQETLSAFLESRRRLDVKSIEETEAILARSVDEVNGRVQVRLAEFVAVRNRAQGSASAQMASRSVPAELESVRADVLARRRDLQERTRQRDLRIAQLQMQITEQSATLGERHPDQIAAREALSRVAEDDEGMTQAAAQVHELERTFVARGGSRADLSEGSAGAEIMGASPAPDEEPEVVYARSLLRMEVDEYQDLLGRLNNARLELQTARAAFAFRYIVTAPPERPREPGGMGGAMMMIGGLIAGSMAGVMVALVLELRGRVAAYLRTQMAE